MLTRDEVAEQLVAMGCEQIDTLLPDHSTWRSPWGEHFFIPEVGPDGFTPEYVLEGVIRYVIDSKPRCN